MARERQITFTISEQGWDELRRQHAEALAKGMPARGLEGWILNEWVAVYLQVRRGVLAAQPSAPPTTAPTVSDDDDDDDLEIVLPE